ncbi:MAG TPA: IclR family transcriptional regulator [Candidatus Eisenbacteria bacterium]|nr:IclR family transcriptional regulator [Candidatus Eisenbacteria bacterium]
MKQTDKPLSSLAKGLELLLKLKELGRPLGLSEAARLLGFNKATTFRLLVTLERYGFLERDNVHRNYKIGVNAFSVGSGYLNIDRRTRMRAVMRQLVAESGHTVTMSVLDGVSVVFIDRLDGTSRVRVTVEIGSRAAGYASASGKVLLAELSDLEIKRRFKGERLRQFTSTTITSFDRFLAEIAQVRLRGFATSNEESTKGLCAISVPVRNQQRSCIAALTIAFPSGSLTKKEQAMLTRKLLSAASEIERLGVDEELLLRNAS